VCAIVIAVLPASISQDTLGKEAENNPYYEVDSQIQVFEAHLDQEDSDMVMREISLP
jgi:hypothetical protein